MMRSLTVTCTGLLLLLSGCAPTRSMQEENALQRAAAFPDEPFVVEADYRIRAGDEIELIVWEQPGFNTQTTVSGLGTITVPLVGEVRVSGLTRQELEEELRRQLATYITGEINLNVSIRHTENMLVSVYGMVTRPDNYPLIGATSIFKVLSTAGGPAEQANIRSVKIYRKNGNPNSVTLDLTRYLDSGDVEAPSTLVHPGDIVYVPRKENAIREMSDFLRDAVLLFGIFRVFN